MGLYSSSDCQENQCNTERQSNVNPNPKINYRGQQYTTSRRATCIGCDAEKKDQSPLVEYLEYYIDWKRSIKKKELMIETYQNPSEGSQLGNIETTSNFHDFWRVSLPIPLSYYSAIMQTIYYVVPAMQRKWVSITFHGPTTNEI